MFTIELYCYYHDLFKLVVQVYKDVFTRNNSSKEDLKLIIKIFNVEIDKLSILEKSKIGEEFFTEFNKTYNPANAQNKAAIIYLIQTTILDCLLISVEKHPLSKFISNHIPGLSSTVNQNYKKLVKQNLKTDGSYLTVLSLLTGAITMGGTSYIMWLYLGWKNDFHFPASLAIVLLIHVCNKEMPRAIIIRPFESSKLLKQSNEEKEVKASKEVKQSEKHSNAVFSKPEKRKMKNGSSGVVKCIQTLGSLGKNIFSGLGSFGKNVIHKFKATVCCSRKTPSEEDEIEQVMARIEKPKAPKSILSENNKRIKIRQVNVKALHSKIQLAPKKRRSRKAATVISNQISPNLDSVKESKTPQSVSNTPSPQFCEIQFPESVAGTEPSPLLLSGAVSSESEMKLDADPQTLLEAEAQTTTESSSPASQHEESSINSQANSTTPLPFLVYGLGGLMRGGYSGDFTSNSQQQNAQGFPFRM